MYTMTIRALGILLLSSVLTQSPAASAEDSAFRSEDQTYAVFLLLHATRNWLDLDVPARFQYLEEVIQPILAAHPEVSMKFWDTEHFNAEISDVLLLETQNLGAYQSVVEQLRETQFWGHHFEVRSILPAIENAYATYYDQAPLGSDR